MRAGAIGPTGAVRGVSPDPACAAARCNKVGLTGRRDGGPRAGLIAARRSNRNEAAVRGERPRHGRRQTSARPGIAAPTCSSTLPRPARPSTAPTRSPTAGTRRRSAGPPRTSSTSSPRPAATPACWRSSPTGPVRSCGSPRRASSLRSAEGVGLVPGGRWDETVAGTNGIGMALVTGRPAAVFATEHWCEPVRDWVCYSAPVHAAERLHRRRHRPQHDVGTGQPARPAHGRCAGQA